MVRVDLGAGELGVHVSGRRLVVEAMTDARCDTGDARLDVGEQDHVVEPLQVGGNGEPLDRPGADDTVVDSPVAAGDEPPRRRRCGLTDDRVLRIGGRQPRVDAASAQEGEELVAFDEDARLAQHRQTGRDRRLAGARRPAHHDQLTSHPPIVASTDPAIWCGLLFDVRGAHVLAQARVGDGHPAGRRRRRW